MESFDNKTNKLAQTGPNRHLPPSHQHLPAGRSPGRRAARTGSVASPWRRPPADTRPAPAGRAPRRRAASAARWLCSHRAGMHDTTQSTQTLVRRPPQRRALFCYAYANIQIQSGPGVAETDDCLSDTPGPGNGCCPPPPASLRLGALPGLRELCLTRQID